MAAVGVNGAKMRNWWRALLAVGVVAWLCACAPEVGSPKWCENMREKPKGDWTTNEALEFARSCVL